MKKNMFLMVFALLVTTSMLVSEAARADEDEIAKEEVASESVKDRPEWTDALKTKYHLSDAQIQTMKDSGLTFPQIAMVSTLSEKSGKPMDDILKMRTTDKMGWGKIAKELGIAPKEIGQSVAAIRHEIRDEKRAVREERMAKKEARRAEKADKKSHKK
jgi:hypothetical protein